MCSNRLKPSRSPPNPVYKRARFPAAVRLAGVSFTVCHTLNLSVRCVCGPDMPPTMMTGLHTHPVTPTSQTAVSVCEAHFKKGDFAAFKLTAKLRSGIRFNINNKHAQAGLRLLQHLFECARARVTYWMCVMFSKCVLSDLSWHHHPCLCGETAWLLLGNRVRRRPRHSLPKHRRACTLCPPIRVKGRFCARATKTRTPSYRPSTVLAFLLPPCWPSHSNVTQETSAEESGPRSTKGRISLRG